QVPRRGSTLNEGVFSSWNGQHATQSAPLLRSAGTRSRTTSSMGARSLIASIARRNSSLSKGGTEALLGTARQPEGTRPCARIGDGGQPGPGRPRRGEGRCWARSRITPLLKGTERQRFRSTGRPGRKGRRNFPRSKAYSRKKMQAVGGAGGPRPGPENRG